MGPEHELFEERIRNIHSTGYYVDVMSISGGIAIRGMLKDLTDDK